MAENVTTPIDWSTHDRFPEDTCTCRRCEAVFRSHAKCLMGPPPQLISRKPCPRCGEHGLTRISSDPETYLLRGHDRG